MQQNRPKTSTTVSPKELKAKLDAGEALTVVDVREPEEYEGWNIAGSLNVPLDRLLEGADFPRGAPVVTVCAHGMRSATARDFLASEGYDARSLDGGMVAWNSVYDVAKIPGTPAEVFQMRRVGKGCLSYVVASGGEAAIIDPTSNVQEYIDFAAARGLRITKVVDTHAHADHVSGSRMLVEATGAEYHAPDEVGPKVPHVSVVEAKPIRVGNAELRPIATPGHTAGSTTYLFGDLAFTGDSLFVESVGRPDLGQDPRPNAPVLHDTLHRKILALPPGTRVLPGHYGEAVELRPGAPISATLAELRARIPALAYDRDRFVEWVVANTLPKPQNFEVIKQINTGKMPIGDPEDLGDLEAGANRCAVSG